MMGEPVKNGIYWIESTHVYECWFGGEWKWTVTEEEWQRTKPETRPKREIAPTIPHTDGPES